MQISQTNSIAEGVSMKLRDVMVYACAHKLANLAGTGVHAHMQIRRILKDSEEVICPSDHTLAMETRGVIGLNN